MSMPMAPPAPPRFSMMTGVLRLSDIFCPITRARMSFAPPARNGTTNLIGLLGKSACAFAGLAAVANTKRRAVRAGNGARGVMGVAAAWLLIDRNGHAQEGCRNRGGILVGA